MFKCEYCAKTFDENWILQRHKREVHEWESQFQCGKCEKKFKRKCHLDRHEKTCCRCQRCNTQFDSLQEKKNHACKPLKKPRIAENEHAEPVQCPGVELRTEPSPAQPQPIVVEKTVLNSLRNETEQSPHPSPSTQLPTIPSGAPATVLTSPPPLTPAPRRRKSLKIKRPNAVSNLPPPPPLKAAPGFFATSPEPPRKTLKKEKAEIRKKRREIKYTETIDEQDPDLKSFISLNWDSIRTFSRRGPIQNLFNFYYNDDMRNLIVDIAKTIMKNQKN